MGQAILIGLIVLVASNGLTWLTMLGRQSVAVYETRSKTQREERTACDARVQRVADEHNRAVDERIAEAVKAARELKETPAGDAEIRALCKRSASCRSREAL